MRASRLVDILRGERASWEALLARIGPDRMDLPGVEGTWSVKQIVAHLTWDEGVVVEGARQLMSTGTFVREGLRALSMDERNTILAAQSRARPVPDVLAESEQIFGQLLAVIAACPDDILNDPRR
ncbi:MAG TPA: maleylpyruvate isomerase N-terminal domain-containing protein [Chloroflexota bacterium]|nr:maleylpyruvate isomerase N-terminal domain-containing protein [Chloroflexota bacterium]